MNCMYQVASPDKCSHYEKYESLVFLQISDFTQDVKNAPTIERLKMNY